MDRTAIIIGSGFSGLSSASFMAKAGWKTLVIEQHSMPGGRARQLSAEGFSFDMGPSWYWMPDVFDRYFECFGKKTSNLYSLKRLDPSYRVVWADGTTDIPADLHQLKLIFDKWEPGSGDKLDRFLEEAKYKYDTGMKRLVYTPGLSLKEFVDKEVISGVFRLDIFTSMKKHIRKYFRHPRIRQLLEFPVLFLGALPEDTPALYSLMNYADIIGGTWFPEGGIYSVVQAMHKLAVDAGVEFHFNEKVTGFEIQSKRIMEVITDKDRYSCDTVIASADYHFIEQSVLPHPYRTYTEKYWESRKLAPSCLLFYVGINKKLRNVVHHTLFFDTSFDEHAREIYINRTWPREPLFYVSVTSITDPSTAPPGCENLFFLIPVAAGLENDTDDLRERYFQLIMGRFEKHVGEQIRNSIVYKKSFAGSDFSREYNAYKGNAYGLANTLRQTAILKPRCKSDKINNLYYTGQLTVPGPGVPPSLISGEVVAGLATQEHQNSYHEHRIVS